MPMPPSSSPSDVPPLPTSGRRSAGGNGTSEPAAAAPAAEPAKEEEAAALPVVPRGPGEEEEEAATAAAARDSRPSLDRGGFDDDDDDGGGADARGDRAGRRRRGGRGTACDPELMARVDVRDDDDDPRGGGDDDDDDSDRCDETDLWETEVADATRWRDSARRERRRRAVGCVVAAAACALLGAAPGTTSFRFSSSSSSVSPTSLPRDESSRGRRPPPPHGGEGPKLPPPDLDQLCSIGHMANERGGHADCVVGCAGGICCMKAEEGGGGGGSCYADNADVCQLYSPCATLLHSQPASESGAAASSPSGSSRSDHHHDDPEEAAADERFVPPPPSDLPELCSDANVLATAARGYFECRSACDAGSCCAAAATRDAAGGCRSTHPDVCESYFGPCAKLEVGLEDDRLDPSMTAAATATATGGVNETCAVANVSTTEGKIACERLCAARSCCFTDDPNRNCRTENRDWCAEYAACESLIVDPTTFASSSAGATTASPEGYAKATAERCEYDSVTTHADLIFCESGCRQAAKCCSVPTGREGRSPDGCDGDAKAKCEKYGFCVPFWERLATHDDVGDPPGGVRDDGGDVVAVLDLRDDGKGAEDKDIPPEEGGDGVLYDVNDFEDGFDDGAGTDSEYRPDDETRSGGEDGPDPKTDGTVVVDLTPNRNGGGGGSVRGPTAATTSADLSKVCSAENLRTPSGLEDCRRGCDLGACCRDRGPDGCLFDPGCAAYGPCEASLRSADDAATGGDDGVHPGGGGGGGVTEGEGEDGKRGRRRRRRRRRR